jgi:hypothetical protein
VCYEVPKNIYRDQKTLELIEKIKIFELNNTNADSIFRGSMSAYSKIKKQLNKEDILSVIGMFTYNKYEISILSGDLEELCCESFMSCVFWINVFKIIGRDKTNTYNQIKILNDKAYHYMKSEMFKDAANYVFGHWTNMNDIDYLKSIYHLYFKYNISSVDRLKELFFRLKSWMTYDEWIIWKIRNSKILFLGTIPPITCRFFTPLHMRLKEITH